jgi:hypothetical protein
MGGDPGNVQRPVTRFEQRSFSVLQKSARISRCITVTENRAPFGGHTGGRAQRTSPSPHPPQPHGRRRLLNRHESWRGSEAKSTLCAAAESRRVGGDITTPRRDSHERRRPDETLLYQLIEEHWPTVLERAEQSGGLPDFIVEEFEAYLRCGRLEHGLAHFACRRCGESLAVAYSCKKRGFCPSCTGRRMADVAAHLVDEVLPEVPVRQWVCSLPWRLRYAMGYDRKS